MKKNIIVILIIGLIFLLFAFVLFQNKIIGIKTICGFGPYTYRYENTITKGIPCNCLGLKTKESYNKGPEFIYCTGLNFSYSRAYRRLEAGTSTPDHILAK